MMVLRALAILALVAGFVPAGGAAAPLENCLKAEAAYQAGDHELEIELYTRCIEHDHPRRATLAVAYNNRGVARHAMGDPESAIADYDKALSLDADYAVAYSNRGMAYLATGAVVLALRDYGTAIDLDPAYGPAYANRCWLFGFMGYGDQALADCEASLRLGPDDAATLDSRAFAYWILEDQERARQDLERARRLDPARPSWQERFVEFERKFSVGYPYSAASVQSADGHGKRVEQTRSHRTVVLPARGH